ncbi:MAG: hypothetical protein AAF664_00435 [Planctomycetota bacterium]
MAPPHLARYRYPQETIEMLFGSAENIELLQDGEAVEVYRLRYHPQDSYADHLDAFDRVSEPVTMTSGQVRRLKELFLNPTHYQWDRPGWRTLSACSIQYSVDVQFMLDGKTFDFLLCFGCSSIAAFDSGDRVYSKSFSEFEADAKDLFKEVLGSDNLIGELPEDWGDYQLYQGD